MAKANNYGKRYTPDSGGFGWNRGAIGLNVRGASDSGANHGAVIANQWRLSKWIQQAVKPDWKPSSDLQRKATLSILTVTLSKMEAATPEELYKMVQRIWVGKNEIVAAIKRLTPGTSPPVPGTSQPAPGTSLG